MLLNYVLQTFLSNQLPFEGVAELAHDKSLFFDFGRILRPRSCHRQTVFTAGGAAPGLEAVHVN